MFAIQQSPAGSLDTLGGFGFPATPLPPAVNLQAFQRLQAPQAPQPFGAMPMPDPAVSQMFLMQQQMNQVMLGMMQMLLSLMLNRNGGGAAGQQLASPVGGDASGGTSGGGGSSAVSGSGTTVDSSQTPKAGGPKVQKLIDAALSKQGTPYVFGAAGPDKFDCSGLVSWALKQAGSTVGRMTAEGLHQHYSHNAVSKADLQPGDLVFFWSPNDRGIPKGKATHIEIYLGNGKTMGTDCPKEGAKVEPINWSSFIGGARPPELAG